MPPQSSVAPQFAGLVCEAADASVDLLFVAVSGTDDALTDLPGIDEATGNEWTRAVASGEFRGKLHETFVARVTGGHWKARRVAFIGAGPADALDAERIRRVAASAGHAARRMRAKSVGWVLRGGFDASVVADGLSAAEFDAGSYKTDSAGPETYPDRVEIIAPGADAGTLADQVRRGRIIGESANFARGLGNEPGNVLTPTEFAARIERAAADAGLTVEVLPEERLRQLGMRLLLAVAQGSSEAPRFIVIRHEPEGAPTSPVLAFVGKGVTFDSGGISIKPADGMERMKDDMAGAAAVAGAMCALARLGAPWRVLGLIPTVENMPGQSATRPGDVVAGASGKTVEIINTDAEGRLILADALWYAQQLGATHLVDVATLTGACVVALGKTMTGLFGHPDSWVDTVRQAASRGGDRLWPMPIYEEATEQLRSEIADLINAAGRPGGAVTAAAFLREFAGGLPWAHLDIAGTAWAETRKSYQPKGATGVAVRTLIELGMTGGAAPTQ